jgi:hypothetical protein
VIIADTEGTQSTNRVIVDIEGRESGPEVVS